MLLDSSYLASLPRSLHLTKTHLRGLSAAFPTAKVHAFVQAAARADNHGHDGHHRRGHLNHPCDLINWAL